MDDIITSSDGTRLSTRTTGDGPPLLLVHGATGSKDMWGFVTPSLEPHHTVHVYDRRGRGGSDDGGDGYSLEAEVDDLSTVIAACAQPPHLVAHSFGAVCALEAAAGGADIASLVVYEPPVHLRTLADQVADTRARLDADDASGALERFLPIAGSPPEEVAFLQTMPEVWQGFVAVAAATLGRELGVLLPFDWEPSRYADVDVPVQILAGELTDSSCYPTTDELLVAFPHAAVHVFEGQRHVAMSADPAMFAEVVLGFTTG